MNFPIRILRVHCSKCGEADILVALRREKTWRCKDCGDKQAIPIKMAKPE